VAIDRQARSQSNDDQSKDTLLLTSIVIEMKSWPSLPEMDAFLRIDLYRSGDDIKRPRYRWNIGLIYFPQIKLRNEVHEAALNR